MMKYLYRLKDQYDSSSILTKIGYLYFSGEYFAIDTSTVTIKKIDSKIKTLIIFAFFLIMSN